MQTGVGNGSCGPTMLEKYKVNSNKQYTFTYRMRPVTGETNSVEQKMAQAQKAIITQTLNGIEVDGRPLPDFSPDKHTYTIPYLSNRTELPLSLIHIFNSSRQKKRIQWNCCILFFLSVFPQFGYKKLSE